MAPEGWFVFRLCSVHCFIAILFLSHFVLYFFHRFLLPNYVHFVLLFLFGLYSQKTSEEANASQTDINATASCPIDEVVCNGNIVFKC